MNDNYLWDRTGEPDGEIQKLEEVLGSLRFQSQPLRIPADVSLTKKRPLLPLAIAAAIALLIIAAGLWFRISRPQPSPQIQVKHESATQPEKVQPPPASLQQESVVDAGPNQIVVPRHKHSGSLVALSQRRPRPVETRQTELSEEELAQKEQLVTALRLVSVKLNLAQRKTQGLPQSNIIRNQHKIG